ncbi:2'-5' RNA ligase [Halobacillus dabanensis]|uniref:2'-5' RNA ligase n=1 Tax=Halobacillus dabanensis TaxID=240302 RepID=A0A1I3NM40_HALDA|nr:RNA 2',3'-cyclic phosphodiesterase [Halobacillus dabanensis]SFJ10374.1 2'-5' RNA ligase [Halobacillus dabanensis]
MNSHYFIGVKISEEIKQELVKWQTILKEHMDYKIWVHEEDFHITLKFLGGCSDDIIDEYIARLRKGNWPDPFPLTIGPAGTFGNKKQPRVFHAGVERKASLLEMKNDIEDVGEKLGFKKRRKEIPSPCDNRKKTSRRKFSTFTFIRDLFV